MTNKTFKYQKERAKEIKERVGRLHRSIKELEKAYKLSQEHDYINFPDFAESFNNELYDLAFELHNMEVVIEGKLEIE